MRNVRIALLASAMGRFGAGTVMTHKFDPVFGRRKYIYQDTKVQKEIEEFGD